MREIVLKGDGTKEGWSERGKIRGGDLGGRERKLSQRCNNGGSNDDGEGEEKIENKERNDGGSLEVRGQRRGKQMIGY